MSEKFEWWEKELPEKEKKMTEEEAKWEGEAIQLGEKRCLEGVGWADFISGYLQACRKRQEEIERLKKNVNEAITFLAAPDMKWDQAMRILFRIVDKEYPF